MIPFVRREIVSVGVGVVVVGVGVVNFIAFISFFFFFFLPFRFPTSNFFHFFISLVTDASVQCA